MKKFLTTISKKNITKIFLLFLAFLLVMLFCSLKTVYAANGGLTNGLYENALFKINSIYNDDSDIYLNITSKRGRNGSGQVYHNNFTKITGYTTNNTYVEYDLTISNSSVNGYVYSDTEIYHIDNANFSSGFYFKVKTIDSNDESFNVLDYCIVCSSYDYGVKTLKTAEAYAYIYSEKKGWPWEGNKYLDIIYFSLFVDGVGRINPSNLQACRFAFKDKNSNWVYLDSNFVKNGTKDYHYSANVMGVSMNIINVEDAYLYQISEPSRTDGLRSSFKANMYACENGIDSIYLNSLKSQNVFSEWPDNVADSMEYVIIMENAPKLNTGATRSNNNVDTFGIVQFTYWDENSDLIVGSLYDDEIAVVKDPETGEIEVIGLDPETGELILLDDYSIDEAGNVHRPDGSIVGFSDKNHVIANPEDKSIWDYFGDFASLIKICITIALFVLGLVLVLKLVRLLGSNKSKGNNVNITVKSGSSKGRRRK